MNTCFKHIYPYIRVFLIFLLWFFHTSSYAINEIAAKKNTSLYKFKINPDLPPLLANKEDAPCFGYENITYDSCNNRGKYYSGNGLEVLSSKFLEDYLSSYDLNSSYVCFKHDNPTHLLKSIFFVWFSQSEIPKKIAIYGIQKKKDRELEIFLGDQTIDHFDELNGYVYSTIHLNLKRPYDRYLIHVIQGGDQNRLLARAIIPDFSDNKKPNDALLNFASYISKKMIYGNGVNKEDIFRDGVPCEKTTIRNYIVSAKSAHCGNFSYVFVHDLSPSSYQITSFGLKSPTGAVHNIVEVNDGNKYKTVDPTLGLVYTCSVSSLIDGTCDYKSMQLLAPINPIFRGYCGINFYYNATIISQEFNIEQMKEAYCDAESYLAD